MDIKVHVERELRSIQVDIELYREDEDKSLYSVINELFEYRNQLVHEIDLSIIGHVSLRDMWDLDRAVAYGNAIISAIKLLEGHITKYAPQDFPNRLTVEGHAEDEYEKLEKAISAIEDELSNRFQEEFQEEDDLTNPWEAAVAMSRQSLRSEIDFLAKADFLHPVRHLDMRRSVQIDCLKNRLAYLTILKSEFDIATNDRPRTSDQPERDHNIEITNPKGQKRYEFAEDVSLAKCQAWLNEYAPNGTLAKEWNCRIVKPGGSSKERKTSF